MENKNTIMNPFDDKVVELVGLIHIPTLLSNYESQNIDNFNKFINFIKYLKKEKESSNHKYILEKFLFILLDNQFILLESIFINNYDLKTNSFCDFIKINDFETDFSVLFLTAIKYINTFKSMKNIHSCVKGLDFILFLKNHTSKYDVSRIKPYLIKQLLTTEELNVFILLLNSYKTEYKMFDISYVLNNKINLNVFLHLLMKLYNNIDYMRTLIIIEEGEI